MADEYQRGMDQEWLEYSNQELGRMLKKRDRSVAIYRFLAAGFFLASLVMGWALHKISQNHPIRELLGL